MSDSVLDLIDNVIDAHGDAMRWSPNAPDPTPPSPPRRYVTVNFALLDEAFIGLRSRIVDVSTAFRLLGDHLKVLAVQPDPAEVARKARLRRMRHLYRQRRR